MPKHGIDGGKLVDAEPSRFLEEIDEQYLHYIAPKTIAPTINRFVDKSLFDDAPKGIRFQKPIQRKKAARDLAKKKEIIVPKNLKKVSQTASKTNLFDNDIIVGNIIEHERFGRGEVISLEGKGPDKKAMIQFGTAGKKKPFIAFCKVENYRFKRVCGFLLKSLKKLKIKCYFATLNKYCTQFCLIRH